MIAKWIELKANAHVAAEEHEGVSCNGSHLSRERQGNDLNRGQTKYQLGVLME